MWRWMALCGTVGCFQTVHRPVCLDEEVREVADDEETPLGSADDLLAVLVIEAASEITLADGGSIPGSYRVQRGEGSARYVETETGEDVTRRPGFGRSYYSIAVACGNYLSVPVEAELASEDESLLVPAHGDATTSVPVVDSATLSLEVPWGAAVLPAGEVDPEEYENKGVSMGMTVDGDGVVGTVTWGGTQELPDGTVVEQGHEVAVFVVEP
jgi:hypothetical protein